MAITISNGIISTSTALSNSGAISRGGGSIPTSNVNPGLGSRAGGSGAVNRGGSSIPNAGVVGGLGERGGSSGSVSRGESSIPNAGVVGNLGDRGGSSGAVSRGESSIPNGGPTGNLGDRSGDSGAVGRGASSIPNAGRGDGLGEVSGNSGAINRGTSSIPSGARVGSAGLRGGTLRGASLQRSGGLRGSSLRSGSGGLRSGLSGGGEPLGSGARKNKVRKRTRVILCGKPISGDFHLEVVYGFDEFGRPATPQVRAFRATLGGKEWTPQNALNYVSEIPSSFLRYPEGEQTETRHVIGRSPDDAIGWPGAGFVALNIPSRDGREVLRSKRTATVTNGASEIILMGNPESGRSSYVENACFIP